MAGIGMKDIKRRIKSVENTKQITKAMELVASSKLRKAKEEAESSRPYFQFLYSTLQEMAQSKELKNHYLLSKEGDKKGYIVIAGDRGLAGGYNANVFKYIARHVEKSNSVLFPIGRKAVEYCDKKEYTTDKICPSIADGIDMETISEITASALHFYKKNEINSLHLIYTEFISAISQETRMIQLLPLDHSLLEETDFLQTYLVDQKNPNRRQLGKQQVEIDENKEATLYEPSKGTVFDTVVPLYLSGVLYGAMAESYASEQGARRTAMESASKNAEDMIGDLELRYNRARQAAITQEISEIVSGAQALQ